MKESNRYRSVLERLRKVISPKEKMLSSEKIYKEAIRLKKLKDCDWQGLFSNELRNFFFTDYYLNPRLKKKEEIDVNELIAIILAVYPPFNINDVIAKHEIDLLEKTLKGEESDFLTGKKESNFITPAYVILRSMRERDSYWLITAFKDMPTDMRKKLKENVREIFEKITCYFSEERKKEFLDRFRIDLELLYHEYRPKPTEEKRLPFRNVSNRIEIPFFPVNIYSDRNLLEETELTKLKKTSGIFDEEIITIRSLCGLDLFRLRDDGAIVVNNRKKNKKYLNDPDLDRFKKLKLNNKQLGIITLIAAANNFNFSFREISAKDPFFSYFESALSLVFSDEFRRLFQNKDFNYSSINRELISFFFKKYRPQQRLIKGGFREEVTFLTFLKENPEVLLAVFALKKVFLFILFLDQLKKMGKSKGFLNPASDLNYFTYDGSFQNIVKEGISFDKFQLAEDKITALSIFLRLQNEIYKKKKHFLPGTNVLKKESLINIDQINISGIRFHLSVSGIPEKSLIISWKDIRIVYIPISDK